MPLRGRRRRSWVISVATGVVVLLAAGALWQNAGGPDAAAPSDTYVYQGKITRYGVSAQYNLNRRVALYLSMTDVNAINKLGKRHAPQTPEWARGLRYQELGYYTTIGVKGTF